MTFPFALTENPLFKVGAQVSLRAPTGTGTCPSTADGSDATFITASGTAVERTGKSRRLEGRFMG